MKDNFLHFFIKTYIVGAHKNRLGEPILMSTHNIGFYEEISKIISELSLNIIKYALYLFFCYLRTPAAAFSAEEIRCIFDDN